MADPDEFEDAGWAVTALAGLADRCSRPLAEVTVLGLPIRHPLVKPRPEGGAVVPAPVDEDGIPVWASQRIAPESVVDRGALRQQVRECLGLEAPEASLPAGWSVTWTEVQELAEALSGRLGLFVRGSCGSTDFPIRHSVLPLVGFHPGETDANANGGDGS